MTAHPEFTVLLARQRTGTNALRSVLGSHAEICCLDEVFMLSYRHAADPLIRASNYFTFLEQYCAGDVTKAFPDRYAEVFTAYLAYLRGLTTKRLIVIDVKYNSTHHLTDVWRDIAEPTLFQLLKTRQIGVLHLKRRNLLRCLISSLKAWDARRYHVRDGRPPADRRLSLPAQWALERMESWAAEDEAVAAAFDGYDFYKSAEYAELFPDATGGIDGRALFELAEWFGVSGAFSTHASLTKLSSLPLDQTIENFDELRAVLQGTPFERFLDDEPAYHRQPALER